MQMTCADIIHKAKEGALAILTNIVERQRNLKSPSVTTTSQEQDLFA